MDRVRARVKDKRVLALVKAFLKAGVLTELGEHRETHTGTPQGGILSPLIFNIALTALDGHVTAPWKEGGAMSASYKREATMAWMSIARCLDATRWAACCPGRCVSAKLRFQLARVRQPGVASRGARFPEKTLSPERPGNRVAIDILEVSEDPSRTTILPMAFSKFKRVVEDRTLFMR